MAPADAPAGVSVVYASPAQQVCIELPLAPGMTVREAIERSGLLARFPAIDLALHRVGIYGALCELDRRLAAGDRVEIYLPLQVDPKEARRRRAQGSP